MAGQVINEVTLNILAATGGSLTVATSASVLKRAYGYLQKTGQPGMFVKVSSVPDLTHVVVQQVTDRGDGVGYGIRAASSPAPSYGFPDASSYAGGLLTLPAQEVYDPNA